MKIAVISDIHDNVWKLEAALIKILKQKSEALICCGDLCSPFVIGLLKEGFPKPLHIVFGNNDADLHRITQQAASDQVMFYGEFAEFMVENERLRPRQEFIDRATKVDRFFDSTTQGKRIAVNHFNYLARPIAASGKYDVVFYGHNHQYRHERLGQIDIINPGAIMGYNPSAKGERKNIDSTFLIYDTTEGAAPSWYEVIAVVEDSKVRQVALDYKPVPIEAFRDNAG